MNQGVNQAQDHYLMWLYNITLVDVDRDPIPINSVLGNLTSDLAVVVSNNTIEKYVNCSNGVTSQEILIKKQCKCSTC